MGTGGSPVKIWGLTEGEIRAAAKEARVSLWNDWAGYGVEVRGKALTCRLCVDTTQERDENGLLPFQKVGRPHPVSRRGRRLPYVTWEGHREFMRVVFRDHPEARIKSAVADYRGRDEFWAKHPSTKGQWVSGY